MAERRCDSQDSLYRQLQHVAAHCHILHRRPAPIVSGRSGTLHSVRLRPAGCASYAYVATSRIRASPPSTQLNHAHLESDARLVHSCGPGAMVLIHSSIPQPVLGAQPTNQTGGDLTLVRTAVHCCQPCNLPRATQGRASSKCYTSPLHQPQPHKHSLIYTTQYFTDRSTPSPHYLGSPVA